jgi:hypothetical protein
MSVPIYMLGLCAHGFIEKSRFSYLNVAMTNLLLVQAAAKTSSKDGNVVYTEKTIYNNDQASSNDIEVLASLDTYTEAGTLTSEVYGIELTLPVRQLIGVRILPAFDICGQLVSDGTVKSILLPPIIQCDGKLTGPVDLSFKVFDTDKTIGSMHVWCRSNNKAIWKLHESESSMATYNAISNTQQVTTTVSHFTEFALGVMPTANEAYLKARVMDVMISPDKKNPPKYKCPDSSNANKKFIGNLLTDPCVQ